MVLPLAFFVQRYGVNVPFSDQWGLVQPFVRIAAGDATIHDFLRQFNEHRMTSALPVMAVLAFASGWDVRWELWLDVVLGLVTAVGLHRLVRHDARSPWELITGSVLACTVALGPQQWENWLMGIQISWLLVQAPVVWAVVVLSDRTRPWPSRLARAAGLCVVASFAEVQGLLAFPALLPLVLTEPPESRGRAVAIWVSLFAVVTGAYAVHVSTGAASFEHPAELARHALTVIGAPLTRGLPLPPLSAPLLGAGLAIAFATLAFRKTACIRGAAWVSLGLFALLFAGAVGVGRAGFGPEQAYAPRYAAHSLLLPLAIVPLLRQGNSTSTRSRPEWLCACALLLALLAFTARAVMPQVRAYHQQMLLGRACLEIADRLDEASDDTSASCLGLLAPGDAELNQHQLRGLLPLLARLGFGPRAQPLSIVSEASSGYLDQPTSQAATTLRDTDTVRVSGWARWPGRATPADLALISVDRVAETTSAGDSRARLPAGGPDARFVAAASVMEPSLDVAAAFGSPGYTRCRWSVAIPARLIGAGRWRLSAWAYGSPGLVGPLHGHPIVEVSPSMVLR